MQDLINQATKRGVGMATKINQPKNPGQQISMERYLTYQLKSMDQEGANELVSFVKTPHVVCIVSFHLSLQMYEVEYLNSCKIYRKKPER